MSFADHLTTLVVRLVLLGALSVLPAACERATAEQARLQLLFPKALHPGVKVVGATARPEGDRAAPAVALGDEPAPVAARMPYVVDGALDLALREHRWQMTFTTRVTPGPARTITPVRLLDGLSPTRGVDDVFIAVGGSTIEVRFGIRGRWGDRYGCILRDGAPLPVTVVVRGQQAAQELVPRCQDGIYRLEWEVPRGASPGETFPVMVQTELPLVREAQLPFKVTVPGTP